VARMIPDIAPSSVHYPGERLVFEWLRDSLPRRYVVFHSLRVLEKSYSRSIEREADFVVLHPVHGLLVLEVKGGKAIKLESGRWWRGGAALEPQPDWQAARVMHALMDWLRARRLAGSLSYSFAIVFPEVRVGELVSPGLDARQVLDRGMCRDVEGAIVNAYSVLGGGVGVGGPQLQRIEQALSGMMCSFVPLGGVLDDIVTQQWTLDHAQLVALRMVTKGRSRLYVEGGAGTGKTELALAGAVTRAVRGERVLLTCFNNALAALFVERLDASEELSGHREQVVVRTVKKLAADLAPLTSSKYSNDGKVVTGILIEASEAGEAPRFDSVIVDEAQDFEEEWLMSLAEYVVGDEGGFLVFADRRQQLFDVGATADGLELGLPLELEVNYRNTKAVAAACRRIVTDAPPPSEASPEGVALDVILARRHDHRRLVVDRVRRLLVDDVVAPHRIVLIGPWTEGGSMSRVPRVERVPMTRSAAEWRRGGRLLLTTARSFKGLEADVVVLFDVEGLEHQAFTRSDLYVALSRARAHVISYVSDERVSTEIRGA